jgi:sugar lactone lactonase YvrE
MAVDEEGNVYAATMLPQGPDPAIPGGITVISPEGKFWISSSLMVEGKPEPLPSNLCFGGPDRRTAFITLAGTGRLAACEMMVPGSCTSAANGTTGVSPVSFVVGIARARAVRKSDPRAVPAQLDVAYPSSSIVV